MSELPKGWVIRKLSDVALVDMGQSPKGEFVNQTSDGMPFYQGKAEFGKVRPSPRKWCSKPTKVAEKDDILMSIRAPVGPTNYCPESSCIGRGLAGIRAKDGVHQHYLFYFFKSIEPWLSHQGTGSTFKAINGKFLRDIDIKIAPIDEQKRIADKLDSVLAKVEAAQARLDKIPTILKRFRQSVLAAATSGELTKDWRAENHIDSQKELDELVKLKLNLIERKLVKKDLPLTIECSASIPSSWRIVNLGGLANKITDGEHKTPKRSSAGNYLLSARNIRDGFLSLEKVDFVDAEEFEKLRKRCAPQKGDILISCSGSVGRVALCDKDESYVMVRSAALVQTNDMYQNNQFIMYALQSPSLQDVIVEKSRSTAQSNLFLGPIKELPIPYPPKSEQLVICQKVTELFSKADTVESQYELAQLRLGRLSQSILAKAFKGELLSSSVDSDIDSIESSVEALNA